MSIFVNLETRNSTSSLSTVGISQKRDPYVLTDPQNYKCAIDRFSIHKCWLPVFENASTYTVKLIKKSDSSEYTDDLDFTGLVDSNNLMWNVDYFLNALNASIEVVCADVSIASGFPTMSLNRSTWIATLDFSGVANFADDYYLEFNEPLYSIFSTFLYADVVYSQTYFRLSLVNSSPYTTVTAEAIELSPIDKIYVISNRMPLVYEYTPASTSNDTSRNSEPILTDFEFEGANRFPLNTVAYTATSSGQYRFHSMTETSMFNTIDLAFYYKTYANNSFPLYMLPSGACNVKLLFEKIK